VTVIFQITILLILGEDAQPWFTAVICNLEVQSRIFSGRKASTGYLFDLLYLRRFLQWILPMLLFFISLRSMWWIWQKQVCLDDALGDPCFVAHPPYSVSSFRPQFKVCFAKATRPIQRQFYHTIIYIYIYILCVCKSVCIYYILYNIYYVFIYDCYRFLQIYDYIICSTVMPYTLSAVANELTGISQVSAFPPGSWTSLCQPSSTDGKTPVAMLRSSPSQVRRTGGFGDGQWSKKSHPLVN
jgi:hypothetical protein